MTSSVANCRCREQRQKSHVAVETLAEKKSVDNSGEEENLADQEESPQNLWVRL